MTWIHKIALLFAFVGTCLSEDDGYCLGPFSGVTTSNGGATYYPKAQSFRSLEQGVQIRFVELYMLQAFEEAWKVRLLVDLPAEGGERGRIDPQDLDAKTIAESSVSSSSRGWVRFNFDEPIPIATGRPYYLFVDSYDLGDFGPDAQWACSPPGAQPGPYEYGTGWIFVYGWSDNSNYREEFEKHIDYAFRVFTDC